MYKVIFDEEAINFLQKLETPLRRRIYNKVLNTKDDPLHFFERLQDRTDYKLRVGDYRVIADIHNTSKRIEITLIGHRKNIYKQLERLKRK